MVAVQGVGAEGVGSPYGARCISRRVYSTALVFLQRRGPGRSAYLLNLGSGFRPVDRRTAKS
jgi:hypothetical protein